MFALSKQLGEIRNYILLTIEAYLWCSEGNERESSPRLF